jgi:hypothetical protein
MKVRPVLVGLGIVLCLAACGQAAQAPAVETIASASNSSSTVEGATPVGTAQAHFDPTEAIGGGSNASSAVTNLSSVLAAVPQASQLQVTANASPPGATGADVASVSILAQDSGGVLKSLDSAAKQRLGDSILTAAAGAWPNATISLLVTSSGGQIIGTRPKGGPNSVIAT